MQRLLILALLCSQRPALAAPTLADELQQRQAYGLAAQVYAASPLDARSRLGLADSYFREGRLPAARAAYEAWLARHVGGPQEAQALLGLARSRAGSGDFAGAAAAARDAGQAVASPEAWEPALMEADALYQEAHYQEADRAYESVGMRFSELPEPAVVPYGRAWSQFRLAQLPRRAEAGADSDGNSRAALALAARLFSQAVALDKGTRYAPGALYQQAECLYALGQFGEAATAYKDFEKRYPEHELVPAARYSLAWCRFEQAQWKDAATAFHRFSVVHPDHALAAWGLYLAGVSLARAKDYDLAQSAYELCLKKYPDSGAADRAQYGLAWLATMRQDHEAAAAEFELFLKRWPESSLAPSAVFLMADSLYQQGRYAGAHEQYLALLKRYAKDPLAEDALYYAANSSLALGELERSRDEFQQFLRLRADSSYARDARRRLADCLYGLGKLDEAERSYLTLRKEAPGTPEAAGAALGLGWVSFSRRDWPAAALRFRMAALESGPDAPEAWLRAGDALFNSGEHAQAQNAYHQATRSGAPARIRTEAHMGAGWAAYRLKDFGGAYGEWGNAQSLASDPGQQSEAAYWMGWALFRQGRFDDAAAAYAGVAARYPGSHLVPDALVQQANSLQNAGKCEAAIPLYKQVSASWPDHPRAAAAMHGLQICYGALGRDDEALGAAKSFLKEHKDSEVAPEVQYQVAEHYLAKKDFAQAETELDTLKSQFPKSKVDLTATYWRGQARFKNLKFNEAIQDWKDLVARQADHPLAPRALFKIGLAWYRLQEYPQAESTFRAVIDTYGNTPDVAADARFNLGMTYKRMGRDADAITAYQAVIDKHPGSELASMSRIRIGYIYEDAGDLPRAVEAYRALAAADKGKLGAEAQYLVGDCLVAQKQSGEALLAYDAVAQNFPAEGGWVVTAQAKGGELLETLGRNKEALARYEAIVKAGGDPTWVLSAKRRVELLRQRMKASPTP